MTRRRDRPGDERPNRLRQIPAIAWPSLIIVAVLIVDHEFAFGGRITNQHEDILSFWLPNYCFLGRNIAAGSIPQWNPSVAGGIPFAADPQTGWLYLPAMLLFSILPCDVAIRWYLVLLPIAAGLGIYWFLKSEGISPPAAAAAGVGLALVTSGSYIGINVPFSASFALTALLLASTSRCAKASAWSARCVWAAVTAVVWMQLAAAHMGFGLVLGSLAMGSYLAARLIADVRAGRRRLGDALLLTGLLLVAVPSLSVAFLLPRMAYLHQTALGSGYRRIGELSGELSGGTGQSLKARGVRPTWPLGLIVSPGSYLGATLVASFAAWRVKRLRHLWIAFAGYAALWYVASLDSVAKWMLAHAASLPFTDFYLHSPHRARYGVVLALPILIGLGIESIREARSSNEMITMFAPGIVVWWILPFLMGTRGASTALLFAGMASTTLVLAATRRRSSFVVLLPVLVAAELAASGLAGQTVDYVRSGPVSAFDRNGAFPPLRRPVLDAAAYVREGPIARFLLSEGDQRYMSIAPKIVDRSVGYIRRQSPEYWGLLANQRSMLLGLEDAQAYNPTLPLRLWQFSRATADTRLKYNFIFYTNPRPSLLDLFQVGWIVSGADVTPPIPGASPALRDGEWAVYGLSHRVPRASILTSWQVEHSPSDALRAVTSVDFDPSTTIILEQEPGIPQVESGPRPATAVYRELGSGSAELVVDSSTPAVVLIRNSFEVNWHAEMDGQPIQVIPADYVLQAVVVPAGRHTIRLTYHDPRLMEGLIGSGVALAFLLGSAFILRARRKPDGGLPLEEDVAPDSAKGPPPPE